ncbi:MAG: DNA cytosine methyltransferase [Patescibacteria group bacterium]
MTGRPKLAKRNASGSVRFVGRTIWGMGKGAFDMSRVLVACEESQIVCKAFRARGHEAYSCDILSTSGNNPEWHIQGDVVPLLGKDWDLIVAFPPCVHLSVSGARHFEEKRKDGRQQQAIDFFMLFTNLKCSKVAIENSVGIMSTFYRKSDQIIQPHQFGHPESKKTCLWLKGLPLLTPTNVLDPPASGRWDNQTPSGQNKLGPSAERSRIRSKTYTGIADAMSKTWG